ncbi:hypothetical protein P154DRAFT_360162 [Amniculicola lignicola CBS 123094]|uniref:Uncharacterized protein n=1 Tax=Amniculicola lignicola CBS 123094 TaxID=1392246 RepID=A0A6A5W1Z1_9PLEO|nr:hypothetical protein P154DRAFT_360162 [Amniculicola lignicola CBS 123094]
MDQDHFKTSENFVSTTKTSSFYIKSTSSKYLGIQGGSLAVQDGGYTWTLDSGTSAETNTIQDPNTSKVTNTKNGKGLVANNVKTWYAEAVK